MMDNISEHLCHFLITSLLLCFSLCSQGSSNFFQLYIDTLSSVLLPPTRNSFSAHCGRYLGSENAAGGARTEEAAGRSWFKMKALKIGRLHLLNVYYFS